MGERMASTKYHDEQKDDPDDCSRCARKGCTLPVHGKLWITIRGNEYDKAFCRSHRLEEHHDEEMYRLGM